MVRKRYFDFRPSRTDSTLIKLIFSFPFPFSYLQNHFYVKIILPFKPLCPPPISRVRKLLATVVRGMNPPLVLLVFVDGCGITQFLYALTLSHPVCSFSFPFIGCDFPHLLLSPFLSSQMIRSRLCPKIFDVFFFLSK